jgi:drug/metabolite transporter (DMT)-like permease
MSAHTYTLLCDLKVLTTGLANYLVLQKSLSRQSVMSLCVLFAGIAIGELSTLESGSGGAQQQQPFSRAAVAQLLPGVAVMVLVALLSATASVYTEWVMNHAPRYRHETIHLQVRHTGSVCCCAAWLHTSRSCWA